MLKRILSKEKKTTSSDPIENFLRCEIFLIIIPGIALFFWKPALSLSFFTGGLLCLLSTFCFIALVQSLLQKEFGGVFIYMSLKALLFLFLLFVLMNFGNPLVILLGFCVSVPAAALSVISPGQ